MEIDCTIFVTFLSFIQVAVSATNLTCSENYASFKCENITTVADFPDSLPANILKVTFLGTNQLNDFPINLFRSHTWANVSELVILEFSGVTEMQEKLFDGLEKLRVLTISSCTQLRKISPELFISVPDIEALYLDGNPRLTLANIESALTGKLEKLKYLSLIGIEESNSYKYIGKNLSKALSTKRLTYLDLSELRKAFVDDTAVQEIFPNMKYVNLSFTYLVLDFNIPPADLIYFQNLELLDISGTESVEPLFLFTDKTISSYKFEKMKYVFAPKIFNPDYRVKANATYTFENDTRIDLKVIDLSQNNIQILNITFSGRIPCFILEMLNLSSNNLELITPSSLSSLLSLKVLDLSNNLLHRMQFTNEFSRLFYSNNHLEIIILKQNYLSLIPFNLFSFNAKLRLIDLSENELSFFNIDISNTSNVLSINLRQNRLKNLPTSFLLQLEQIILLWDIANRNKTSEKNIVLYHIKNKNSIAETYKYGFNASDNDMLREQTDFSPGDLTLNVVDNQLICSCDTLDFVQWLLHTNIGIVNRTQLVCAYENKSVLLNKEIFETVKDNCRFIQKLVIGISISVAIIAGLSTFGIFLCLRRRKALRNQNFELLKRELLQTNTQFNFVVFLSYCSRDYHVVDNIILPSLKSFIKETFNTQKELVCTGADNFVPGLHIIDEIHRCVSESLVIVPVITPAFLESDWSQRECIDAIEKHRQVVVLMEEHTNTHFTRRPIRQLVQEYTRATWSYKEGKFNIRPSWNILFSAILQTATASFQQHRILHANNTIELDIVAE